MKNKALLEKIERLEINARLVLEQAAALKEELSGGSDGSNFKTGLSDSQKDKILGNRRRFAFRK